MPLTCVQPDIITSTNLLIGIGAMIGFLFILLRYMVAHVNSDEYGLAESKYMAGDLLLSLVLAIVIINLISVVNDPSDNIVVNSANKLFSTTNPYIQNADITGHPSVFCIAKEYLLNTSARSFFAYKFGKWAEGQMAVVQSSSVSFNRAMILPTYLSVKSAVQLLPGLASFKGDIGGRASFILSYAVLPNLSQFYLFSIFSAQGSILSLLGLAVAFRHIPFLKGFGNVLFSLVVTFALFLPLMVFLESYIFIPPGPSQYLSLTDASLHNKALQMQPVFFTGSAASKISTLQQMVTQSVGQSFAGSLVPLSNMFYLSYSEDTHHTSLYSRLMFSNELIVDITGYIQESSKTLINAAYLATINLLATAASIKMVQQMLGDSNSIVDMFVKWV